MNNLTNQLPVIFVIEDDSFLQSILRQCLKIKFEPVIFSNPVEASASMQKGNLPDLIISDFNTPGLNGLEFLEQIQSSGFFSTIPVIILTGAEETNTRIKCLETGADDFIVKPFNPRELVARVTNILKRSGKIAA